MKKLYETLKRMFHQVYKHLRVGLKKTAQLWLIFFHPTSRCLNILMKHSSSCLKFVFQTVIVLNCPSCITQLCAELVYYRAVISKI